jgi:hypothetical protein
MAGWDNTPRRGVHANVFHGASSTSFRRWLRGTILHERNKSDESVVFINAWNKLTSPGFPADCPSRRGAPQPNSIATASVRSQTAGVPVRESRTRRFP